MYGYFGQGVIRSRLMARPLNIEIETTDRSLAYERLETSELSSGDSRLILADGSTAIYLGTRGVKEFGTPETIKLVIELGGALATGVASNWLYDKLKGKRAKLRIERTEVEIEPNRIRVMIEKLERED